MTAAKRVEIDPAAGVDVAASLEGLAAIHTPVSAAVIWRREPLRRFQDWIDALEPAQLPQGRLVLRPSAVRDAVREYCDLAGAPDCVERGLLVDDVAALAHGFAEIMGAPYLRVRLDVVTTNACRKFHVDAVVARLICTYRGTGTQYGFSTDGAEPERVVTAATGDPIVLRGTSWPEDPPAGLLHRSPPIAGSGETRLLLVLDPLDAMEGEMDHVVH